MELILINQAGQEELIDVDIETKFVFNGLELPALTRLASVVTEKQAVKVQIANSMPKAKQIDVRAFVPRNVVLELTDKLHYDGAKRETDVYARIVELSPSATKAIHDKLFEQFKTIRSIMDEMNVVFKEYKPKNATKQGSINHHFPSPQFPETTKN